MTLYAITDEILTPPQTMLFQIKLTLLGGAKYVQLRDKHSKFNDALALACSIKELCAQFNAKFIVNDNIKLAKESGADGVHLGQSDDGVKFARDILGDDAIIGSSCYGSLEIANTALENGASYIAFGSMFASSTKPNAKIVPLSVITEAKKIFHAPVCAIGGIDLENAWSVKNAGADMIAVISALWSAKDATKVAQEFSLL